MFLNCLYRKRKQTAIISFMQCEMLLIDVVCFVVVLQNCMCFVEGAAGSGSDTCVTCDVCGNEEGSIKVEDAIDIKDEIPEAINLPPIKTEHEVRL